jgi:hypothetical protein
VFTSKNPQRRTLFKDENWKSKYAYQIANSEVKFATPSKTLEEIRVPHIQTVGLQRKYDGMTSGRDPNLGSGHPVQKLGAGSGRM